MRYSIYDNVGTKGKAIQFRRKRMKNMKTVSSSSFVLVSLLIFESDERNDHGHATKIHYFTYHLKSTQTNDKKYRLHHVVRGKLKFTMTWQERRSLFSFNMEMKKRRPLNTIQPSCMLFTQ